LTKVNKSHFIP